MKLLLDEHMNPAVARQLRKKGYDPVAVQEVGVRGASDEQLLEFAAREKRILVTCNIRDFQLLIIEWHRAAKNHAGIVFVSEKLVSQRSTGSLVRALTRLAASTVAARDLENLALFLVRGSKGQARSRGKP